MMKKLLLIGSLFALLAGCGGGGNTLKIEVKDGASYNDYINNIRLRVDEQTLVKADWKGGEAITINLPSELPDIEWLPQYFLQAVFEAPKLTMTNENVKTAIGTLEIYNAYDNRAGWMDYMGENDGSRTKMILLFADSDSTISGTNRNGDFKVTLKKGWNRLYITSMGSRTTNITTDKPDVEMYWKPFL